MVAEETNYCRLGGEPAMNRIARATTPRAGAATPSHVRVSECELRLLHPPHRAARQGRLGENLWRGECVPKRDCGARFVLANVSHKGPLISLNLQGDGRMATAASTALC